MPDTVMQESNRTFLAERAWTAWRTIEHQYSPTHRVYGIAMQRAGDFAFQLSGDGRIECVCLGGYGCMDASPSDLSMLDEAIEEGRFMVCVAKRGRGAEPILRAFPGKEPGWSVKSLHPGLGGLGTISATVIR